MLPHGVVTEVKWDIEGIAPDSECSINVHYVPLPTVGLQPQIVDSTDSKESVTLLYYGGLQIAFPGATGFCGHESEAEGEEEKDKGRTKLSRWDLEFLAPSTRAAVLSSVC